MSRYREQRSLENLPLTDTIQRRPPNGIDAVAP